MPCPRRDEAEFRHRLLRQFIDPSYDPLRTVLSDIAWQAYGASRESRLTRKAGTRYPGPDYDLSFKWLAAKTAIADMEARYRRRDGPRDILIIDASWRSEHSCPDEMSKSYQLAEMAWTIRASEAGADSELLGLFRLASGRGPAIRTFPLVTARDWMNYIYLLWAEPYATNHDALDADSAMQDEVHHAARRWPKRRRSAAAANSRQSVPNSESRARNKMDHASTHAACNA